MKATHAYVGFNAAGEARAFCSDDKGCEFDTAGIIAEWNKMGRTTKRMPIDEARRLFAEDAKAAEVPE